MDEMCVDIDASDPMNVIVTMTGQYEDYHACVPFDMEHDDWVADNMDDGVEVFRVIEVDMSNRHDSTEFMLVDMEPAQADQAWDYFPWYVLVARVSSDLYSNANDEDAKGQALNELTDFIQSVYKLNHASIDCDDYVMHAFRIPKPQNNDEETTA